MTDLSKLSARQLHALINKRDAAHRESLREAIAAGYGMYTGAQMRQLAAEGDALATRNVASAAAWFEAKSELDARRRWHGDDRPIRRKA